jgi:hypothetical protein
MTLTSSTRCRGRLGLLIGGSPTLRTGALGGYFGTEWWGLTAGSQADAKVTTRNFSIVLPVYPNFGHIGGSVYWRPIFNILEGSFQLLLVNAQHIKFVPGRKTDVKDAQ